MSDPPADMIDRPDRRRFELAVGDETVFATYQLTDNVLAIRHVEAPPVLRGTGAAGQLMEQIVRHARNRSLKISPLCSYAAAWLRRHPETADIVA